jgi:formate dehydrogenase iron-sulfur subunit
MVTYKFLNVIERCIDCGGCFAICKQQNEVPEGTARMRVVTINEGKTGEIHIPISCMHCTDPPCEAACPTKAIYKREESGIVMMDKSKCIGCGYCGWACPFGAPKYPHDLPPGLEEYEGIMDKCTLCVQPFVQGVEREPKPRCALFCSTKARLGGDIAQITPLYNAMKAARTEKLQERV